MSATKVNLLGLDRQSLADYLVAKGHQRFRAEQLIKWIHTQGQCDFSNMSNIGKALCSWLQEHCVISPPKIVSDNISTDGTRKWLVEVTGGSLVEMVLIPEEKRSTLCISSQAGCALNCSFCSTARQGFARNLSAAEIIGQLWLAKQLVGDQKISNVVMMGMGEPLLNLDSLLPALSLMRDDLAYGLPRRRVTVSTSGVVPGIDKLIAGADVSLALSLHAAHDKLRDELVPLNKKYPLEQVLAACRRYTDTNKRYFVTMEYVMLKGVNDSVADARRLVKLLANVKCKMNLIPFNPFPNSGYECSTPETMRTFSRILQEHGMICTLRKTRGEDINAACGQLVGNVLDRTKRSTRYKTIKEEQYAKA